MLVIKRHKMFFVTDLMQAHELSSLAFYRHIKYVCLVSALLSIGHPFGARQLPQSCNKEEYLLGLPVKKSYIS